MSQAVLSPNLTKKFQWEVSQIADKERSLAPLYRWFKCKLKPPKNLDLHYSDNPLLLIWLNKNMREASNSVGS